jgi:N-acetylglutamate synthase-like GNAT family acetyltransferase
MRLTIRKAGAEEIEALIPILRQAEETERALRWSLANLSDAIYRLDDDNQVVGAATMQWRDDRCEIMELAIAPERQRQGLGKHLVAWLLAEARRRGKRQVLVGTANSSIDNIAFYQKCGFRMDQIRKDYFSYYGEPHYEDGIQVRDMLVFRYDLAVAESCTTTAQHALSQTTHTL